MEREADGRFDSPRSRYKSFVHFLRHTLHIRPPKQPPSPIEVDRATVAVMEMGTPRPSPVERLHFDTSFLSDCNSDALPSTSGASVSSLHGDPVVVYDDPFVCVTSDGIIHVRNYYEFNSWAEFRPPSPASQMEQARLARRLKAARIKMLYLIRGAASESVDPPKSWGLARGGVWETSSNTLFSIVVDDGSPIKAGVTVLRPKAFIRSIW
ncbi:unnamed protein product, partial [Mesorhabditis spiculigera]